VALEGHGSAPPTAFAAARLPRVARRHISKGLAAQGYLVESVHTGAAALARAADPDIDLLILDLGLPDMDGAEVLRRLRGSGVGVAIIVLSARGEISDRVDGLDLGADDYLTKPFAFDELLARVRARLRHPDFRPAVIRVGPIRLDVRSRRTSVAGKLVDLTPREFAMLELLMRHPGEVVTRQDFLSEVWSVDYDLGSNLVDVYVGHLRRKIGHEMIQTVRGSGYRLTTD